MPDELKTPGLYMGISNVEHALRDPCDDCGDGRTLYSELRETEVAEDKKIVEYEVSKHRDYSVDHGRESYPALTHGR